MFIDIKFFKEKVMGGHQAEGLLRDFIILQASQIICFKHFRSYFREKNDRYISFLRRIYLSIQFWLFLNGYLIWKAYLIMMKHVFRLLYAINRLRLALTSGQDRAEMGKFLRQLQYWSKVKKSKALWSCESFTLRIPYRAIFGLNEPRH